MPLFQTLLYREEPWKILDNASVLLGTNGSELASSMRLWYGYREIDPDGALWKSIRLLHADEELRRRVLVLIDSDAFMESIVFAELLRAGPMGFYGTLVASGSLMKALRTISRLVAG